MTPDQIAQSGQQVSPEEMAQLQAMFAGGVSPDQIHGEQQAPQVLAPQDAAQEPEVPQDPQADPEGGAPMRGEVDPQAQQFFEKKMLSHMDAIRGKMGEDPEFAEGLSKSRIGPELVSELAHWSKDRIIDLLTDIIANPEVGSDLHDAYQKSLFHGRHAVEEWRENKYHKGADEAAPMDEESSPLAPLGDEAAPVLDEEAGPSSMGDEEAQFIAKMSRKPGA